MQLGAFCDAFWRTTHNASIHQLKLKWRPLHVLI